MEPNKKDFTLWSIGLVLLGAAVGSGATAYISSKPRRKIRDKDEE